MKLGSDIAAVITGGASGMGEATARFLAQHGVKVAIFDRDIDRGETVAAEIGGVFCEVDVTDVATLETGFAKARKAHGQERVFVACAGIAPGQKTVSRGEPHDPGLFAKTININLIGTFNAAAQSATGMTTADTLDDDGSRGVVIMTASVAGYEGQVGQAAMPRQKGCDWSDTSDGPRSGAQRRAGYDHRTGSV